MNNCVLITGASGFVGKRLVDECKKRSIDLRFVTRSCDYQSDSNAVCIPEIDGETDWSLAFSDVKTVIHLAARAHIMSETIHDPLDEYRKINTDGTLNLAKQAALSGVKRFIFISSIKVNGETTTGAQPFNESSSENPEGPYGISKYEAERGLRKISEETGMEFIIIRPPLVYGPGVKANFLNLIKLADSFFPLPFSLINNRRSILYVDNLVDFIIMCIDHPEAKNEIFIVSDDFDISLSYLLKVIRVALDKPAHLFPLPSMFFWCIGRIIGKVSTVDRLIGDLQVDSYRARCVLSWQPPFTLQQGIKATIAAYLEGKT